jgi:hypothetical protein
VLERKEIRWILYGDIYKFIINALSLILLSLSFFISNFSPWNKLDKKWILCIMFILFIIIILNTIDILYNIWRRDTERIIENKKLENVKIMMLIKI